MEGRSRCLYKRDSNVGCAARIGGWQVSIGLVAFVIAVFCGLAGVYCRVRLLREDSRAGLLFGFGAGTEAARRWRNRMWLMFALSVLLPVVFLLLALKMFPNLRAS